MASLTSRCKGTRLRQSSPKWWLSNSIRTWCRAKSWEGKWCTSRGWWNRIATQWFTILKFIKQSPSTQRIRVVKSSNKPTTFSSKWVYRINSITLILKISKWCSVANSRLFKGMLWWHSHLYQSSHSHHNHQDLLTLLRCSQLPPMRARLRVVQLTPLILFQKRITMNEQFKYYDFIEKEQIIKGWIINAGRAMGNDPT